MQTRVPLQTIITHRDGKRVVILPNRPFEFTDAEMAEFGKIPGLTRAPQNEFAPRLAPAAGPVADEGAVMQTTKERKIAAADTDGL